MPQSKSTTKKVVKSTAKPVAKKTTAKKTTANKTVSSKSTKPVKSTTKKVVKPTTKPVAKKTIIKPIAKSIANKKKNKEEKKRKRFLFFGVFAILALAGCNIGIFTYARYITSYGEGTTNVDVAEWKVKLTNQSGTEINSLDGLQFVSSNEYTHVAKDENGNDKIAPGSVSDLKYSIDLTGTEVDAAWKISYRPTEMTSQAYINGEWRDFDEIWRYLDMRASISSIDSSYMYLDGIYDENNDSSCQINEETGVVLCENGCETTVEPLNMVCTGVVELPTDENGNKIALSGDDAILTFDLKLDWTTNNDKCFYGKCDTDGEYDPAKDTDIDNYGGHNYQDAKLTVAISAEVSQYVEAGHTVTNSTN